MGDGTNSEQGETDIYICRTSFLSIRRIITISMIAMLNHMIPVQAVLRGKVEVYCGEITHPTAPFRGCAIDMPMNFTLRTEQTDTLIYRDNKIILSIIASSECFLQLTKIEDLSTDSWSCWIFDSGNKQRIRFHEIYIYQ